ncbi:CopG family ribbon-helix-helix protein [Craurococcus roseus]
MAAPSSGAVTTSLKLDPELRDRLRRLADSRRRTPNWLMREAIAQYLAREEARERLRTDALAAWAEYEATGRQATGEAVDAWLARLEAGEADAAPPECRG